MIPHGVTSCKTDILDYKSADVREILVFKYVPCLWISGYLYGHDPSFQSTCKWRHTQGLL